MIVEAELLDITPLLQNTQSKLVQRALKQGNLALAIKLPKFKGLLGFSLGKRRIGTELADVAKRFGLKGILHSDELPNYGISEEEVKRIREYLNLEDEDAFIILLTDKERGTKVAEAIIDRLNQFLEGVPKDTRQALEDGSTAFLRPRPGAARMYPETDHPLIFIEKLEDGSYKVRYGDKEFIYKPKKVEIEKIKAYLEEKLGKNLAEAAIKSEYIQEILWALEEFKDIKPTIIAEIYLMFEGDKSRERVKKILEAYRGGLIVRPAIEELLKAENLEEALKEYRKLSEEELEKAVKEFIEKHKEENPKKLRGLIYREFRTRADMKELNEILQRILSAKQ